MSDCECESEESAARLPELVFYVNGKKVVVKNPCPKTFLVQYLREKLFLTGTKIACGEGGCGSCTVMISQFDRSSKSIHHYARNACLTPICALHGLAVTTIEALGSTKTKLHPLQIKLVEGHGIQCGFCTPGMIMSMYALLRNNTSPTDLQVEDAIKGNLCRCTGYRPILDSFRNFVKNDCPMGEKCCQNQSGKETNETPEKCCDEISPSSQELIFPNELQLSDEYDARSIVFRSEHITWYNPVTVEEVLTLKKFFSGALVFTGGNGADHIVDVLVTLPHKLVPEIGMPAGFRIRHASKENSMIVIGLNRIPELNCIEKNDFGISVGATVTISKLEKSLNTLVQDLPESQTRLFVAFLETFKRYASAQIRNTSTICGSIAQASSQSDLNVLILAAGCKLSTKSRDGEQEITIDSKFFHSKGQTLVKTNEIIVRVCLPFSNENEYFASYKQAVRKDLALAEVNCGFRVEFEDGGNIIKSVSLVFGGLIPTPLILTKTSAALVGKNWESDVLTLLMSLMMNELADYKTIEPYKLSVAHGFVFKFYLKVYEKLAKKLGYSSLSEDLQLCLNVDKTDESIHSGSQVFSVPPPQSDEDAVGQPLHHRWANQAATGESIFIDDMRPSQGELYLFPVTSAKANAKLVKVDASRALAMSGVVGFIDHTSIPSKNITGLAPEKEEIFAEKEVHWVGQMIGAVVAESRDIARKAAAAVEITYEEEEPIITIEDAIAKEAFHLFPWLPKSFNRIKRGDTAQAFLSCDHVIEGQVKIGGQEHFYMETHSVRVVPKNEDGEMDVYTGTQYCAGIQLLIARALNVSQNKIVVHMKRMGGAFGGKEFRVFMLTIPTSIAAAKFNRPVRCMLDRGKDMQMTGIRRPCLAKYKVGFNQNGKIQALDVNVFSNDGFHPDISFAFMSQSLFYVDNCYSIPNVSATGLLCKTNLPPNTAMRGAGVPQSVLICETWINEVASFLGVKPQKIQEMNLYKPGDMSMVNVPIEDSLERCFRDVLIQSNYEATQAEFDKFNEKSSFVKRGIAVVPIKFSPGLPPSWYKGEALVHIYMDGSILLSHGGAESGQGLHTKMIQVASRALDVSVDKIHISETSTNLVPNAVTTGGSSGADINGMAVLNACETLSERLKPYRDAKPDGCWEDWITSANNDKVNLSAVGFWNTSISEEYDWDTGKGQAYGYYTYGAAVSQVEVDCLTGNHVVLQVDIVMDVGKSLNPAIDIGQIEGGFVMGLGYCALEDHHYEPDGSLQTIGAGKYHIPTVSSIPLKMNVSLLKDAGNPKAVYSSKGIGEPPLLLSTSVLFAIKDAVSSARSQVGLPKSFEFNVPATVQSILLACGQQKLAA